MTRIVDFNVDSLSNYRISVDGKFERLMINAILIAASGVMFLMFILFLVTY